MASDMGSKEKFISAITPDSLINIVPDGTTTTFSVSKAMLCDTSSYFSKALNGNFQEGCESTLRFPGFSIEVIEWFLFWAHKRYLPSFENKIGVRADRLQAPNETQMTLISLWSFADAHLIPKLQNEVMRQLVTITVAWHTNPIVIRYGYEIASKGSVLHKFIMDEARYMYFGNPASYGFDEHGLENLAQLPGFMSDFLEPIRSHLIENEEESNMYSFKTANVIGSEECMVKED